MRAAVNTRYGPPEVVQIRQVPTPAPSAGEVLIRVHATTVSRTDCGMRQPHPWFVRLVAGLLRPKCTILGMDFAGEVEAVGAGVARFKPGDRVFGLSPDVYGAHAETLCLPETAAMATMPAGLRFGEAVVCEGAWYADTNLQAMRLQPGQSLLIYGAFGAIGTAAVQLAKCHGAKVTAVVATRHLDLVRSLGADRAVDYTAEDFTQRPTCEGRMPRASTEQRLTPYKTPMFGTTQCGCQACSSSWHHACTIAMNPTVTVNPRAVAPP